MVVADASIEASGMTRHPPMVKSHTIRIHRLWLFPSFDLGLNTVSPEHHNACTHSV
jgi:hypothetical protein